MSDQLSAAGASVPTGLPNPADLARLASQMFAALPGPAPGSAGGLQATSAVGGVPVPANPQPAGLSLPPGSFGPSTPAAVPVVGALPGSNLAPTSPQTPLNAVASAPALVPHAPAANGVPDHALEAAPGYDGRLGSHALGVPTAESFGLPGDAALRQLLGAELSLNRAPVASGLPGVGSGYYFLSPDVAGLPGNERREVSALAPVPAATRPAFDLNAVRRDFPILRERVNGKPLVWFDNAATTQKPQAVIDRIAYFYEHENSNIHRAAHELAARATDAYEKARETVRRFINAGSTEEVIFVRGTTEAINLVAKTWGVQNVGAGDEIIVSHLEHHANIVPWQQLAMQKGATLKVIPVDDTGQVILSEYQKLLSPRTKIVSVTQVSNALGTVVPVREIVALAHAAGAKALVDGAQSVSHMRVDVQSIDADFFVFSGHKIFGPTGIGVVYGKRAILEDMPPWQGGGNMIADVTFDKTVYHSPPTRFEAGTGNIADAVGLGAALEYVEQIGIENIGAYEHVLLEYATAQLKPIPGVRLVGTAADKASVLSFVLAGYSTDEVGQALNREGIAVRTGHHCAQPILRRFGLETTVRPSLAFYNTCEEVDRFIAVVRNLSARR
ncbi:family 2A encapsulin nanocompartment cargo protein cysteine desulfurase [Aquabacterium sp. A08]|uniref:family 2A encapsulin nanocompartment cargo protein cysteine desulfurase n=1 Tax=Aquabacterium sp. A08 TaxID=2718532 RepID=UPI0014249B4B|nr:family 2A encapsulin nanocompartment cargo protein cysteine desulfurase [Aquabacterium sp. A08]NIC43779.1 SufS family cysteine desulfurase [Aquabacterium sp. A08]